MNNKMQILKLKKKILNFLYKYLVRHLLMVLILKKYINTFYLLLNINVIFILNYYHLILIYFEIYLYFTNISELWENKNHNIKFKYKNSLE